MRIRQKADTVSTDVKSVTLVTVLMFFLVTLASTFAAPVDLTSWIGEDVPGSPASNWDVQPGNDSVLQTINSRPSFFYEAGTDSQGKKLSGKIKVEDPENNPLCPDCNDDDFIGFALGLDAGEVGNSTADFILIDWKQADQGPFPPGPFGLAAEGLAISHVTNADDEVQFWNHDSGEVTEIARATTLGSTGWTDFQEYSFELVFTSNLIQVSVDGALELSITAADAGLSAFDDGSFAFYNYSQADVRYSAIEEESVIPEPSTFALFTLGLGMFGIGYRRRKRSQVLPYTS